MTGLLNLPPEIRNHIYFYTESLIAEVADTHVAPRASYVGAATEADGGNYVQEGKWYAHYGPGDPSEPQLGLPAQPNITRVCRKLRGETLPIFYGANRFVISDLYHPRSDGIHTPFVAKLLSWFSQIQPHLSLLTHVEIECDDLCSQHAHETVSALTDLDIGLKVGVLIDGGTVCISEDVMVEWVSTN